MANSIINISDENTHSLTDKRNKFSAYITFCTNHNRNWLHIESFRLFNNLYID